MELALALDKEPELASPTDFLPVPPRLVQIAEPRVDRGSVDVETNPGDFLQALQLVEKFPTSATAQSRLSAAALIEGENGIARSSALEGMRLAIDEDDAPALIASAQVLASLGEGDAALDALSRIARGSLAAVAYAQVLASQREFDAALSAIADLEESEAHALRGWIWLELGEYPSAIRELRATLTAGVPQPDVLANLGYAYAALGERDKAYSATRQALHLAPSSKAIALNLAAYQFAAGDADAALKSLLAIRRSDPTDIMLDAAVAEARLRLGDQKGALRELRSARDRLRKVDATSRIRAEILANTSYLEWKIGKKSRVDAIDAIRKELLRCDFESIDIGRMLARLLVNLSELEQVETLYRGLLDVHDRSALYEIEAQIAFMRGEFGKALSAARRWSKEEPFDPAAAIDVTYLLSEVEGKYEEAARFGEEALRRLPSSEMLRNNVAFARALAGDPHRASRYLLGIPESPYSLATRGLIKLTGGDLSGGNADYEAAAALAVRRANPELATRIRIRQAIAQLELGLPVAANPHDLFAQLKDSDNPVILVLSRQVRRFA